MLVRVPSLSLKSKMKPAARPSTFQDLNTSLLAIEAKMKHHLAVERNLSKTLSDHVEKTKTRAIHEALWAEQDQILEKYKAKITESVEYNLKRKARGRIRIARIPHYRDLGLPLPVIYGFTNVIIGHTRVKKSLGFMNPINVANEVSPDVLHDSRGRLYMNLVAFSRCFSHIGAQTQSCGWTWSAAHHIDESGNPTLDYNRWRTMGSSRAFSIPTPEGYSNMGPVLPDRYVWPAALIQDVAQIDNPAIDYYNGERTGMVNVSPGWPAYVKVEYALYKQMVSKTAAYKKLMQMVESGHNLLLISQDAPEVLMTANGTPTPPFDQIIPGVVGQNGVGTLEVNAANIRALKHLELDYVSYAYSLAVILLQGDAWL